MREKLLSIIEKNSRIDLKDLAVILGMEEIDIVNELQKCESLSFFSSQTIKKKVTSLSDLHLHYVRIQFYSMSIIVTWRKGEKLFVLSIKMVRFFLGSALVFFFFFPFFFWFPGQGSNWSCSRWPTPQP